MPVVMVKCIGEVYEVPCPRCGFRNLFQVQPQEPFLKSTAPRGRAGEMVPTVDARCQGCKINAAIFLGRHIIPLGKAEELFDAGWE